MRLLQLLLIALVCYYIIKLLLRVFMPFLVKYLFKKTQNNFQNQYRYNEEMDKKEGEVTINHPQNKNKKKGDLDDTSEYVDFEDVE